jgi:hypothetical protein
MTLTEWIVLLRARGVTLTVERSGELRIQGDVTRAERRQLIADRKAIADVLRSRTQAAAVANEPDREIVGEVVMQMGGGSRERIVRPLFADEVRSIPLDLIQRRDD